MNLKNYILEYVSSGRRRRKTDDRIQFGYSLEETVDWLEAHGIRGKSWEDTQALPNCNKGELVYLSGPWGEKDNTQWVIVRNYRGQYMAIYPSTERDLSSFFDVNGSKKEIGFKKCLDVLDKMIENPNRRIEFNGDMVVEYVSSGRRNRHQYRKEIVAGKTTIPQLRSFLETNGFEETKTESTSIRNYMVGRFANNTYIDIAKPDENYRLHVSFGEPKVSGKLTLDRVFKFTYGNPFSTASTIDELCEYIES